MKLDETQQKIATLIFDRMNEDYPVKRWRFEEWGEYLYKTHQALKIPFNINIEFNPRGYRISD